MSETPEEYAERRARELLPKGRLDPPWLPHKAREAVAAEIAMMEHELDVTRAVYERCCEDRQALERERDELRKALRESFKEGFWRGVSAGHPLSLGPDSETAWEESEARSLLPDDDDTK